MKLIVRNRDNNVIYGTDNDSVSIVIDGTTLHIGDFSIHNYKESDFTIVEDSSSNLIDPFFPGYVLYIDGEMAYTDEYIDFNTSIHSCINSIADEYLVKSQDESYTADERQAFSDYSDILDEDLLIQYISPSYNFETPPDEMFPWSPACMRQSLNRLN